MAWGRRISSHASTAENAEGVRIVGTRVHQPKAGTLGPRVAGYAANPGPMFYALDRPPGPFSMPVTLKLPSIFTVTCEPSLFTICAS